MGPLFKPRPSSFLVLGQVTAILGEVGMSRRYLITVAFNGSSLVSSVFSDTSQSPLPYNQAID